MPKLRVRVPFTLDVSDAQLGALESLGKLAQAVREHAPALRTLRDRAAETVKRADAMLADEGRKLARKRAKKRAR